MLPIALASASREAKGERRSLWFRDVTPNSRIGHPDQARQPIQKVGDLHCRVLNVDDIAPHDDDERLLRLHAPEIVILPDYAGGSSNPYPTGGNDYQPHAAELYLDGIQTVRLAPRGVGALANIAYTLVGYGVVVATGLVVLAGQQPVVLVGLAAAYVLSALILTSLYRVVGTPSTCEALRDRVADPATTEGLATTIFRPFWSGSARVAWMLYGAAIGETRPSPLVYGRVRPTASSKVLQYWLFYFYNDWWNQHEADWEVVMVFLDPSDRPARVVCSSHLGGTWRPWHVVEPTGPGKAHPRVYVARGSHAMYFDVDNGFHDAVLHQPWAVFDIRGQLTVVGKQDAVGNPDPDLANERYVLKVIPPGAEELTSSDPRWSDWWWLQFRGRWGATDGIASPPCQEGGLRWDHPDDWVRTRCEADSGSWDEMLDAQESGTPELRPGRAP